MSHIIGQFCRTVANLLLQVQKMCVIFNTGIRCDDSDRSGNASVITVNGSTDPDCIRDVFAVGNGNALLTDGAEFFCQFCGIRLWKCLCTESDCIQISLVDGTHVSAGSNNLVYRSARVVYDQLGIPLKGLRITQRNDIPMARGLGSSSACIVAGIMGANALLGDKLTERQMLTLATAIEGHPDNVAPAMLGGFVTSVIDEGQVYSVK